LQVHAARRPFDLATSRIVFAYLQYPQLDPVAFRLGPFAIRWYGIAYLFGFVASYVALGNMIKRGRLRIQGESLAT
jgi:phosphatidylglycerol:prolipoprotein diacylglycerol transferase